MSILASRVLLGAGLTLASYATITTVLRGFLDDSIGLLQTGDSVALAFLGISGLDTALSMVMSAVLVRSVMTGSSLFLTKT